MVHCSGCSVVWQRVRGIVLSRLRSMRSARVSLHGLALIPYEDDRFSHKSRAHGGKQDAKKKRRQAAAKTVCAPGRRPLA